MLRKIRGRWNDLPKVTQLVGSKAGTGIGKCLFSNPTASRYGLGRGSRQVRGQEELGHRDPAGVQLLGRAARSLAPGLPVPRVPEGQSAPCQEQGSPGFCQQCYQLYPRLGGGVVFLDW